MIGTHTYTYCDASGNANQWVSFTVDDSPTYLNKMQAYRYMAASTAGASPAGRQGNTYPDLPAANDARWERVLASPFVPLGVQPVGFTNVRRIPTTEGNEPIMQLSGENVPARIIREMTFADKWIAIDLQGVIGWIHRDYVMFTPFEDSPTSTQEMVAPAVNQKDGVSWKEFDEAISRLRAELQGIDAVSSAEFAATISRLKDEVRKSVLDDLIAALQKMRDEK